MMVIIFIDINPPNDCVCFNNLCRYTYVQSVEYTVISINLETQSNINLGK